MALSQTSVLKLYNTVIEDVISGVREAFLDEGVDEQVLQELKQIWETKLMASKAVELNPEPPEPQPPQLSKNSSSSKGGSKRNSNAQANVQAQTKEPTPPRPQPQPAQQAPAPQITHAPTHQSQHQPQQQNQSQQMQQAQPQQGQHMQNMPVQQQMQQHHHQSLSQTHQQPQQPHVNQQAAAVPADRQISIQIKLPVHGQLPERLITVHVPASAVQGNQLHALFTGPIISTAIALPTPFATSLLQQHVNSTFEGVPGFTPVQVQPVQIIDQGANNIMQQQLIQGQAHGNMAQLDGAMDVDVRRGGSRNNVIPNKTVQIKLSAQNQLHLPERLVVVQIPSSFVQRSQLKKLFTDTIVSATTMLPELYATNFLQHYVNSVVTAPSYTSAQVQPLQAVQQQFYQGQAHGSMAQLDGTAYDSLDDGDMVVKEENSCSSNETQLIAIKIKLPAYNQKPERVVTLQYPTSITNETKESVLHQIQEVASGPAITAALELPSCSTSSFFQLVNSQLAGIIQLDGPGNDSSDDDDDEDEEDNDEDDDPDEDREEEDDENDDSGAREEEPLNSEDDVTDEDPTDLFDTDNVVVCQYDKITRSRNKWKFYLKDGIMNLSGKDFVFQKANGDAEW